MAKISAHFILPSNNSSLFISVSLSFIHELRHYFNVKLLHSRSFYSYFIYEFSAAWTVSFIDHLLFQSLETHTRVRSRVTMVTFPPRRVAACSRHIPRKGVAAVSHWSMSGHCNIGECVVCHAAIVIIFPFGRGRFWANQWNSGRI